MWVTLTFPVSVLVVTGLFLVRAGVLEVAPHQASHDPSPVVASRRRWGWAERRSPCVVVRTGRPPDNRADQREGTPG